MKLRSLSARQAADCEHASTTRCRCRCGGELHGAARAADVVELAMLPEDDRALTFRQGTIDDALNGAEVRT